MPSLRASAGSAPAAHRRATRPDAASIARLIPRKRCAPAARGSSARLLRGDSSRRDQGQDDARRRFALARDLRRSRAATGGLYEVVDYGTFVFTLSVAGGAATAAAEGIPLPPTSWTRNMMSGRTKSSSGTRI